MTLGSATGYSGNATAGSGGAAGDDGDGGDGGAGGLAPPAGLGGAYSVNAYNGPTSFNGASGTAGTAGTAGNDGDAGDMGGTGFPGVALGTASYTQQVSGTLQFSVQPASTTAGQAIGKFDISVVNSSGGVLSSENPKVTLTIKSGPAGASIGGDVSVTAVNGVAKFKGITFDEAGTYKLKASGGGFTIGKSTSFTVAPAAASQLVYSAEPTNESAGTAEPTITVDVEDQFGNIETGDSSTLVTLGSKVVPSGVVFSLISIDDVDGVASFSDVIFDTVGGYKLKATHSGLTPGKSAKFFIQ
ncbi:MAG TPA: hypothetical protein VL992_06305 [Tepidisphaeraceae bacterium]|nr:hypothetical protein [Tepidisphaeraceae bacterium]